jgi:hypothetical protein
VAVGSNDPLQKLPTLKLMSEACRFKSKMKAHSLLFSMQASHRMFLLKTFRNLLGTSVTHILV